MYNKLNSNCELPLQVLKFAGWYPERSVDYSSIEKSYQEKGCIINTYAKIFFEQFYGIKSMWFFKWKDRNNRWKIGGQDFYFEILGRFDEIDRNRLPLEEQKNATPLGFFGFHNPGTLWVSETGTFYITYDYDEENVPNYKSAFDFLEKVLSFPSKEIFVTFDKQEQTNEWHKYYTPPKKKE